MASPLINDLLDLTGTVGATFVDEFLVSYERDRWWSTSGSVIPAMRAFNVRARLHGAAIVGTATLRDDVLLDMENALCTLRVPIAPPVTVEVALVGGPVWHVVEHPLTRRPDYRVEQIIEPADGRHRIVTFRAMLETLRP